MHGNLTKENNKTDSDAPYGNYKIIYSVDDQPLITLGPDYLFFLPSILFLSSILLIMFIQSQKALGPIWKIIVFVFIMFLIASYLAVGVSNPGLIRKNRKNQDYQVEFIQPDQYYCRVCNINKPEFTIHCEDCDICIRGYDHHCAWIGKCIGKNNICRYYTFICSLVATFAIFFVAVLNSTGF